MLSHGAIEVMAGLVLLVIVFVIFRALRERRRRANMAVGFTFTAKTRPKTKTPWGRAR